ncbi:MAG: hypothetical protein KGL19_14180 [Bacteroidota bacterium]|nr:hypothetical protein [Bacteroidota bacterium]
MKRFGLLTLCMVMICSVIYAKKVVKQRSTFSAEKILTRFGTEDSIILMEKAFAVEKNDAVKLGYAQKLAAYYKEKKDFAKESAWLGQIYHLKKSPNNVDLFNWAYSCFNVNDFSNADSAFCLYERKYPDQTYGYYWAAKTSAAIDTSMSLGLAIPHYQKFIEVGIKDTANKTTRKWLITAYSYMAAYQVNKFKNYTEASGLYEKLLALDPSNKDAAKYKEIVDKHITK